MTDIVEYKSVTVTKMMEQIERYKYNPVAMQRVIFDLFDEMLDGSTDIVEPTNPFVLLLESSTVTTAVAIQEALINLRKQYSSLSQTEEELYLHMSDKDFINRFATPSEATFTIIISVSDINTKLIFDNNEKAYKATIARDTEFIVDDLVFTLQYPIDIRRFENGIVQISYDSDIKSPLQILTTNIIDYVGRTMPDNTKWLFVDVPVKQFKINSTSIPVQKSNFYKRNIPFTDQFYHCRTYFRNAVNGPWIEMLTTHTDQVFDPTKPTAVIKVYETSIDVIIPPIYINTNQVSGDVRIDVYTTKGNITINFTDYKINSFQMKLNAIDQDRDFNEFTDAMNSLNYTASSTSITSGGTSAISFDVLRERVINNSVGDRNLPITNQQLESFVANKGFEIIKNIDVITNRIFLATKKLPKPLNNRLITAANVGIGSININLEYLKTLSTIADNVNRVTILSNNLFINKNGIISIVPKSEINALLLQPKAAIVTNVTNNKYLYSPYYYVLDNSESEFEVRVYDLDKPLASNLSFISQNETLQLSVNTGIYNLSKTSYGYELRIVTKSGNFYKQVSDSLVNVQLACIPAGEKDLAYTNGIFIGKTEEGERIYSFRIETNHDVNSDNKLIINNFKMFSSELVDIPIDLNTTFKIFYTTTSINDSFKASSDDVLIGTFILPASSASITHETLDLSFGYSLKNLWTRSRSLATGLEYEKYSFNIPLVYDRVIYETDPVTGSILHIDSETNEATYVILHNVGDPVLDENDEVTYKHKTGDVKLDINGNPILKSGLSTNREIDLFLVDGKYFFSNDPAFISYREEITSIVTTWVTKDIVSIQDILLEQSKIFFYPKTSLGTVKVYPDGIEEKFIESEQILNVNLYVSNDVYISTSIRQQISDNVISLLDIYIAQTVVNLSEIRTKILSALGGSVSSIEISGLGGANNYSIIKISNEHNRLSLNKKLSLQQDGTFIIAENVTINFFNIEKQ